MSQLDHPKSPINAYKHCPLCAGSFEHKGSNWLKCQECGYNYFVNQAPTAGVLILNDKNEVLPAKRKRDPKKGTWQSVGGFIGLDESFEEAAVREAMEELGVEIRLQEYLGSFPENYEFSGVSVPFLAMYYKAKIISGTPKPADDVEEVRYFGANELDDLDITYPALRNLLKEYLHARNTAA
jgi:NADH pyrophosphatase NudC (nudix superfamily)